MSTLYKEVTVALTPDALWNKVSDVGEVSGLLNVITHSEISGETRTCEMADGGKLTERILDVDQAHKRVAYTITDAPFPVEFHSASMEVLDAGNGKSTLRWVTDLKPDAVADQLNPVFDAEMASLAERYPK